MKTAQPATPSWSRGRILLGVGAVGWVSISFLACAGVAVVCLFVFAVVGGIKSSGAYQEAVARARNSDAVEQALGIPIEESGRVKGFVKVTESSGKADLAIPISGSKGSATIFAVAQKQEGQWTFSRLQVVFLDGRDAVNLLAKGP